MNSVKARMRSLVVIGTVLGAIVTALPALAQTQTAPPEPTVGPSVTEQQLLQEFQRIQGRVTIPDRRAGTLIQPEGRDWRAFRTKTLPWIGGILIIGTLALLAAFYAMRGSVRLESGFS